MATQLPNDVAPGAIVIADRACDTDGIRSFVPAAMPAQTFRRGRSARAPSRSAAGSTVGALRSNASAIVSSKRKSGGTVLVPP
ncbi:hypothetical protein, partial [Rhodobium orientis]|uniref:hypothetical protein n=1 Tax=Rhodobium orientis TaxID=34017 RepID=UPI001AECFB2A